MGSRFYNYCYAHLNLSKNFQGLKTVRSGGNDQGNQTEINVVRMVHWKDDYRQMAANLVHIHSSDEVHVCVMLKMKHSNHVRASKKKMPSER